MCLDATCTLPDVPRRSIPVSPAVSEATTNVLTLNLLGVGMSGEGTCASEYGFDPCATPLASSQSPALFRQTRRR